MSAPPKLTAALADRYRIERELGAGGMATVYLAHDVKHDRDVAIKVLRPELAALIGAQRFLAEIKTTANLQHPHILPLHDSGEVDGTVFYVMPFIEGESLRDRLARERQLPVDDALRIATEVADALGYAHGHGVIHRDIKPENILLHGGHALVADFGIALAASTTVGERMTETGMSLGTPTYMSPEQAMGERALDARTDIYALGCVVYEMLLGEPPFSGPSAQAIVAKVMTEKPAALIGRRDRVPPHVEAAVLTALEKLPADRFASARQFALALATPATATFTGARPVAPRVSTRALLAGCAVIVLGAAAVGWKLGQRASPSAAEARSTRFSVALGASQGLATNGGNHVGWSPDGRAFVFSAFDGSKAPQLWVRPIDALTSTAIPGTDGVTNPTFSPDGARIVFVRPGSRNTFSLAIVPRTGGRAVQILAGEHVSGGGVDWSADDWIYFDGDGILSRVRPDGTGRENLYTLDSLQKEVGIGWPQALPGGHAALFRMRRAGDDVLNYTIDSYDFQSRQHKRIVQASFARYVPSGHLVYVTGDGTLMASRFDAERLELTGTPLMIARGLNVWRFGGVDLAISSAGALLYSVGRGGTSTEPIWLSRDGRPSSTDLQLTSIFASNPALSPDGSHLALQINDPKSGTRSTTADIWVKGLPAGPMSRLTFEGDQNSRPRWSHDGRDLFFISSRAGTGALYRQRADGTTPAIQVAALPEAVGLGFDSPDGKWMIVQNDETAKGGDIYALQLGVDSALKPLIASRFNEVNPSLSPDGRWLAYQSDETGRDEVYVRPFPNVNAGKFQVSAAGGTAPQWNHKGDEIFFQTAAQDMVAARVRTTPTFGIVSTTRLFSWLGYFWPYDVSRDDEHFLMLRTSAAPGEKDGAAQFIVVENFVAELRHLLP